MLPATKGNEQNIDHKSADERAKLSESDCRNTKERANHCASEVGDENGRGVELVREEERWKLRRDQNGSQRGILDCKGHSTTRALPWVD